MKISRMVIFIVITTFIAGVVGAIGSMSPGKTNEPRISVTARIVDYGIYKIIDPGAYYAHPESTAGYASQGVKLTLINRTTRVPLQKGIVFGLEYEAEGFGFDGPVLIIYRVKHPSITRPDGTVTTGFDEEFPSIVSEGKLKTGDFYCLSEDWELVPGEWSIAVIYEGRVLVEKTFQVSDSEGR